MPFPPRIEPGGKVVGPTGPAGPTGATGPAGPDNYKVTATLPGSPVVGEAYYVSGVGTVARANASLGTSSKVAGTYGGIAGQYLGGSGDVRTGLFVGGLTLVDGQTIWLSTTDGKFTNTDPSNGDTTKTQADCGSVWNKSKTSLVNGVPTGSGYDGTTTFTCLIFFAPKQPVYGSA